MAQTAFLESLPQSASQTKLPVESALDESWRDLYLKAFRFMQRARVIEDKLASLYRSGKITGGCYVGRGNEAVAVSAGIALNKGDVFAPLIRDQAGRLAYGESPADAFRTYLGSRLGPMRGRDGNVHRGRPAEGYLAMISHLGAMVSAATGMLLGRRLRGEPTGIAIVTLGEGATSTGAFHEGLNLAAVEKLPVVVVVSNNLYAYSTPNSRQFACESLVHRARGYGVRGWDVDGTDLNDCLKKITAAAQDARQTGLPQLVVATLLRLSGHGEHDDAFYVDATLKTLPVARDCLAVAEEFILQTNLADWGEILEWKEEAKREVESILAEVQREPVPDPFEERWCCLATPGLCEGIDGV